MYTILLNNVISKIVPILPGEVISGLDIELSYKIENCYFSKKFKMGYWDGRIKLFRKKTQSFSTGFLCRVRKVLEHFELPYQIEDLRKQPILGKPYPLSLTLRDYQEDIVRTMYDYHRGIIKVATGGGKGCIISGFLSKVNVPTLIIVPKISLLQQLSSSLEKELNTEIGWIGESKCEIRKITVSTMQSLISAYNSKTTDKYLDERNELIRQVLDNVECLIVDEVHHCISSTLKFLTNKAKSAYFKFGTSATPFWNLDSDLLVEAPIGRVIVNLGADELIKKGWLSKPIIRFYKISHPKYPKMDYKAYYTQSIVNNVDRNKVILNLVLEKVKENKSVLVAVTRIEHGRVLENLLKNQLKDEVIFVDGSFISEELKDALNKLNLKLFKCVIATTVFGEGVDIPNLDVLINAKAQSSKVDTLQLAGRALRTTSNKKVAEVIDFYDTCKYLRSHANDRRKAYEEEKFEIVDMF
jgi:superfamily II DNA or RNA helicase